MRYLGLIFALFLVTGMHEVSAQYPSKYRIVIKTTGSVRCSGDFISVNDSLLIMTAPKRVDSTKSITIYKNIYMSLTPEEVKSIRVYRKGTMEMGGAVGLVSGMALGLKSGSNRVADTDFLAGDIGAKLSNTITGLFIGSIIGLGVGALVGHTMSIG